MAFPKLIQRLFQNGGAGSRLNRSIMPDELVGVDAQSFTDAQKKQGRANLGAVSQSDVDTLAMGLAAVEAGLSTKLNTSTPHIVETWSSANSWYRVWSNGLIEQWGISTASGGVANVTFPKAFSNTAYSITSLGIGEVSGDYIAFGARNIKSTGAAICWDTDSLDATSISWYACGY